MPNASRGYSLFELVILVVVLSIVCYFIFLNQESLSGQRPAEMETLAAEMIRMAIHNYGVESKKLNRVPAFPAELDDARDGDVASEQTPLFTTIFPPDGVRTGWKKVRKNQYVFLPSAGSSTNENIIYHYDPSRGTFEKGKAPSNESRVA